MTRVWQRAQEVLVGMLAVFGLLFASAIMAVVVAGMLQWVSLVAWLDNAIPIVVLGLGMMLAGRVGVDVAGRGGVLCSALAAGLVVVVGILVSRASEAHGDGIEPGQIAIAGASVLLLTGGTAWLLQLRRRQRA